MSVMQLMLLSKLLRSEKERDNMRERESNSQEKQKGQFDQ